jgi:hypothetical protein
MACGATSLVAVLRDADPSGRLLRTRLMDNTDMIRVSQTLYEQSDRSIRSNTLTVSSRVLA